MERIKMDSLLKWKNKEDRKPLILQGARQTGKTYLLKEFGRIHFPQTHYINFENTPALSRIFEKTLDPVNVIKELEFFLESEIDIERDLIIFDEIQKRSLSELICGALFCNI